MTNLNVLVNFYKKKGIEIPKLIAWLGRYTIPEDVAMETIAEVYVHLKAGGTEHLNMDNYPASMHHMFEKGLPEDFWVDRHILNICKQKMADLMSERLVKSAAVKTEIMSDDVSHYLKLMTVWTIASGSIAIIFGVYCLSYHMAKIWGY